MSDLRAKLEWQIYVFYRLETQVISLLLFGKVQSVCRESAAYMDILPAVFKQLITFRELFKEINQEVVFFPPNTAVLLYLYVYLILVRFI